KPLALPIGVSTDRLSEGGETDLSRWFLLSALVLLFADLFISLWLRGMLGRAFQFVRRPGRAAPAALLLVAAGFVMLLGLPPNARGADRQAKRGPPPPTEEQALRGALDIRLAYIIPGDKEVDDLSKAGLEGLSEVLRNRPSVEPADPVGLDLEKDEPRPYPLIYWPSTGTHAQ